MYIFVLMSKISFSGIGITSMNGSIGNRTISRNFYGPYASAKHPAPVLTPAIIPWQANFQAVHQVWELITDPQRTAWIKAAPNDNRKQQLKKTLGNTPRDRTLQGFHYFMSTNINIAIAGGVGIITPPKLVQLFVPSAFSAVINSLVPSFNVTFTALPANWSAVLYCTAQLNAGRMSNNQTYLNIIATNAGNTINALAAYTARRGVLNAGKKIFMRLDTIHRLTGQRYTGLYISNIIV